MRYNVYVESYSEIDSDNPKPVIYKLTRGHISRCHTVLESVQHIRKQGIYDGDTWFPPHKIVRIVFEGNPLMESNKEKELNNDSL